MIFRLASIPIQVSFTLRPVRRMSRKVLLLPETRKFLSARGFTIMEVALAATVLALTLMGMIEVVETGSQMLDLSRKQTMAAQILHSEIDQLRLQSWQTVQVIHCWGQRWAMGILPDLPG